MILFSQDKEIVFKLTNAVLLLWVIAATAFLASNGVDLLIKEPVRQSTYEEFKVIQCDYLSKEETDPTVFEAKCRSMYNEHKFSNDNRDYYKVRNFYVSLANVVIVGSVLFFINRKNS